MPTALFESYKYNMSSLLDTKVGNSTSNPSSFAICIICNKQFTTELNVPIHRIIKLSGEFSI